MVGVEMRHNHLADVAARDAELLQLRADLLLGLHPLANREPEHGVPAREVAGLGGASGLAGVDDDHPFRMLDRECVDRKRLGPFTIGNRVQQAAPAMADTFAPGVRDRNRAGLYCVDLHVLRPFVGCFAARFPARGLRDGA